MGVSCRDRHRGQRRSECGHGRGSPALAPSWHGSQTRAPRSCLLTTISTLLAAKAVAVSPEAFMPLAEKKGMRDCPGTVRHGRGILAPAVCSKLSSLRDRSLDAGSTRIGRGSACPLLPPSLSQEDEHGLNVLGTKPKFQIGHLTGVWGKDAGLPLQQVLGQAGACPLLDSVAS